MASVTALKGYGSSDNDSDSSDESYLKPVDTTALVANNLALAVVAAPDVQPNVTYEFQTIFKD